MYIFTQYHCQHAYCLLIFSLSREPKKLQQYRN